MEELLQFDVCSSSSLFDKKASAQLRVTLSKELEKGKVLKNYHLGA